MSKILLVIEGGRVKQIHQDGTEPVEVEVFDVDKEEASSPYDGLINKNAVRKFQEIIKHYPKQIY